VQFHYLEKTIYYLTKLTKHGSSRRNKCVIPRGRLGLSLNSPVADVPHTIVAVMAGPSPMMQYTPVRSHAFTYFSFGRKLGVFGRLSTAHESLDKSRTRARSHMPITKLGVGHILEFVVSL
jgi:hypothetical protein